MSDSSVPHRPWHNVRFNIAYMMSHHVLDLHQATWEFVRTAQRNIIAGPTKSCCGTSRCSAPSDASCKASGPPVHQEQLKRVMGRDASSWKHGMAMVVVVMKCKQVHWGIKHTVTSCS